MNYSLLALGCWGFWSVLHWMSEVGPASARVAAEWMADFGIGDPVSPGSMILASLGQCASLWQPVVLIAALIGLGCMPGRWIAPRARTLNRAVLALLIGFGIGSLIAQGIALAGIADAGLFRVLAATAAAFGILCTIRLRAWRAWLPAGPGETAPVTATLIVLFISWAVGRLPDMFEDAMAYHFAAPEQWLATHRIVAEPQNVAWHFMLGSEALTMPLLAVGGVVGAKLLTVAAAAALPLTVRALAAVAGATGVGAAWAAALASTAAFLPAACWGVKNDLLAAVLTTGAAWGFMEIRRGSRVLTGAALWLLGSAVAVKTTAGLVVPAIAAMVLLPGSKFRFSLAALTACALAVLPPAGWALRNWLHLGNPAYPFLSGIFPTLSWSPAYMAAVAEAQRSFGFEGAFDPSRIPVMPPLLLLDPSFGSPALAVALGIIFIAGAPGLRIALLAGFVAWAATHRFARYLALFLPLVAAAAGPALGRMKFRPGAGRVLVGGLVIPAAFAAVLSAPPPAWREWTGGMSEDAYLASRCTTWEGVQRWVRGSPDSGKVLLTGDERRLGFGRRVISAVGPCQPLLWKWSRESADAWRMRIKIRQAGIGLIVHNYVSAEFRSLHWYRSHDWTAPQLRVFREFSRRWLRVAFFPPRLDFANGGWVVLALEPQGSLHIHPVFFLPQTEGRWQTMRQEITTGRVAEAPAEARRVAGLTQGVRQDEHLEAYALLGVGRFGEALRLIRPGIVEGFEGNGNLDVYAGALASLGQIDEAIRWEARSLARLRSESSQTAYGIYLIRRAKDRRAPAGDWRGALRDAEAATMISPDRWEAWAQAASCAAHLERFGLAAARARRALALNPDHPGLAGMARELETLSHTTISR